MKDHELVLKVIDLILLSKKTLAEVKGSCFWQRDAVRGKLDESLTEAHELYMSLLRDAA